MMAVILIIWSSTRIENLNLLLHLWKEFIFMNVVQKYLFVQLAFQLSLCHFLTLDRAATLLKLKGKNVNTRVGPNSEYGPNTKYQIIGFLKILRIQNYSVFENERIPNIK